jgi:hypothetical protein
LILEECVAEENLHPPPAMETERANNEAVQTSTIDHHARTNPDQHSPTRGGHK